jgi:MerR family Zn(II)-responsive transcriptional regulator of zntA
MYTIGRLARRAKVNTDTIRFYERQGLLASATRTGAGYRLYTDEALRSLAFIRHARRCGFSLAEIGDLLKMHDGTPDARSRARALAARKRGEIREAIESLQAMAAVLDGVLETDGAEPRPAASLEGGDSPLVAALEARLPPGAAARHERIAA